MIKHIIDEVCRERELTKEKLLNKTRLRYIVESRQIAFYLARRYTTLSLQEIGNHFKKDHATVLFGVKNIKNLIQIDNEIKLTVKKLDKILFDIKSYDVLKQKQRE